MITKDAIAGTKELEGLTDDQINAITALSERDEQQVIGAREAQIHQSYSDDITTSLGLQKPEGVEVYDWFKSDVLGLAKGASETKYALEAAQKEAADLKSKIQDGKGNEAIKKDLTDANQLIKALQEKLETSESEWNNKLNESDAKLIGYRIDSDMATEFSDVTFKDAIPNSVRQRVLQAAKDDVLERFNLDVESQGGKDHIVLRDDNGEIVRNADLRPKTVAQLVKENPEVKDIIDVGREQGGAGSKPSKSGKPVGSSANISGAKSQVEADRIIRAQLIANGFVPGSPKYHDEFTKVRDNSGVSELPER